MTTRATLFTQVTNWLRRQGDTEFAAALPTMLTLLESRIAAEVVHSSQEVVTTLSFSGQSATLPADCLEIKSLTLQAGTRRKLERVSAEVLREGPLWGQGGTPCQFAVQNRAVFIAPGASVATPTVCDLVYYARFPALVADGDTNYLLTNFFALYFHGLLVEGAKNLQDDALVNQFEAGYQDAKRNVLTQDIGYRASGSTFKRIGTSFKV